MSEKSKSTAFLLCFFLGTFGVHRFYIGRWKTAVLMLLTLGGLGIWTMIDLMLIIGDKLTDANDDSLRTGPTNPDDVHAGFWVRFAAMTVDMTILYLISIVVSFVGSIALGLGSLPALNLGQGSLATLDLEDPAAFEQAIAASSILIGLLFIVVMPLYFALQTASSHQATVGKRIFDIYVCTANSGESDGKLNLLRGLWRAVCYVISSIPLGLGFVLGAFTSNKRALHDYLAGTKVMYATASTAMGTAAMAQGPRPSEAPVKHAADSTVNKSSADGSGKIIIALGLLLLAGAAALALL